MSTEAEIWGVKKKYLIEMRKLEDKLIELELTRKAIGQRNTDLAVLGKRLE